VKRKARLKNTRGREYDNRHNWMIREKKGKRRNTEGINEKVEGGRCLLILNTLLFGGKKENSRKRRLIEGETVEDRRYLKMFTLGGEITYLLT